jgi:hypothetical protein
MSVRSGTSWCAAARPVVPPRAEVEPVGVGELLRVAVAAGDRQRDGLPHRHLHALLTVPALQARALHMVFDVQRDLAAALVAAYPGELDPVSAAAVVGALAGATQGAALTSLALGQDEEEFWQAMRRGVDIALRGVRTW